MWKFNLFSRRWKEVPMDDRLVALASHSISMEGSTVFTFGGSGIPFGTVSSDDIHVTGVDSHADRICWKRLRVTGEKPEAKYGQCQVIQWPYIFIIGGTTGYVYNMHVHCLNLKTHEWSCLYNGEEQMDYPARSLHPPGRYRHEVVLYKDCIFVLGGGQTIDAFTLEKVPVFDLLKNVWCEMNTTPDPHLHLRRQQGDENVTGFPADRKCHSCVHYKKYAYVFGGRSHSEAYGDLWRLNLDTLEWTCIIQDSVSPFKVFFHSAALTNSGCMYVFGGVLNVGEETRCNTVYKVWLDVPSLQELAWSHISNRLHACRSPTLVNELADLGVPKAFINRLEF